MSQAPVVSVVTIFLDAERFLAEAVDSVRAQTHPAWELLLVDDGSSDGSTALARDLAAAHPDRIRYLDHPGHANRGMSASRNRGIAEARGSYVALLDADDVWRPEKLARQVALLEANPTAGMVFGRPEYWRSWTGDPADHDWTPSLGPLAGRVAEPPSLLLRLYPLGTGHAPCPSDLLFRRAVAERVGGFETSFHGAHALYEDQAFLAKVYLTTAVLGVDESWTRYRQHPDSCMATVTAAGRYDEVRRFFLDWLAERLRAASVRDAGVWRAIRRARLRARHPRLVRAVRAVRSGLHRARTRRHAPPRRVRFGGLRRLTPISAEFGFDRGLPIDRHYIERFLAEHATDVHGRVLEVGDDAYTRRFGNGLVTRRDVLHLKPGNPTATIVADLAAASHIPAASFDCIILTQTLHLVYDVRAALATLARILAPGGVLLLTVPGISQIAHDEWGEHWCWSFTTRSARRLLTEAFPEAELEVRAQGNVLTAIAFLHGLAERELRPEELAHHDPAYELLITARVRRAGEPS